MGLIAGWFAERGGQAGHLPLFLTTGMLGGFTTFSAFSLDAVLLWERHEHLLAALYVGGALIAACSCWMAVSLYFFRRYALSAWIAIGTVPILVVYKIAVIGW